jgi:Xaa-Pro aminopeptidase
LRKRLAFSALVPVLILILCASPEALERQANSIYRARREALANKTNGGAVLLFAPTENEAGNAIYGFRQADNFYYLTGLTDPGAGLLILPAQSASNADSSQPPTPARPYTEILFLPGRNLAQEKWTGPKLDAKSPDIRDRTGFDRVAQLDAVRDELVANLPSTRTVIYTELGASSASTGPIDWLRRANAFPLGASMQELRPVIGTVRVTKDAGEAEFIRKASEASAAAHVAAFHFIKPGVTENEVSALMQYEFMKRGCERPAYAPIVGSGFNSTVLHYSQNTNTIKDGDVVVMDVAGEYSMYASDVTRTVPANGHFTARQREIYDIVLGAQNAAIQAFKSGVSTIGRTGPNSLHQVAANYINTHGKDLHGQPLGQYFIHGLGHYVGLNVHDPSDGSTPLGPGAVFTIEPGIYIPDEKIGVRIEDIFWVNDKGELVKLSAAAPSTADEVEKTMSAGRSGGR